MMRLGDVRGEAPPQTLGLDGVPMPKARRLTDLFDGTVAGSNTVMGVNRNDKDFASKVSAALTRADWEKYKEKFVPFHKMFADLATSDQLANEQLARQEATQKTVQMRGQQTLQHQMGRMGIQAPVSESTNLRQALNFASAQNNIRRDSADRKLAMITGAPLPQVGE